MQREATTQAVQEVNESNNEVGNIAQTMFHKKLTCEKAQPEVSSTSKQFTLDWLTP